jgi:hypothetical protein
MTARELLESLQELSEEDLDKDVFVHDSEAKIDYTIYGVFPISDNKEIGICISICRWD